MPPRAYWQPRLSTWARYGAYAFVLLTFASMALYPGGTYRERQSDGYLFFSNFLSDLGMPESWANRPNHWGAILFVSGEVFFAAGLVAFSTAFIGLSASGSARNCGRAAAFAGVIVALAFIAAGLTPANRVLSFHIHAALLAFRGAFVMAALLALALAADRRFPRRAVAVSIALAVALAGYIVTIEWGPRISSDFGLTFQATAQKCVFIFAVPAFAYLSGVAERVSLGPMNTPTCGRAARSCAAEIVGSGAFRCAGLASTQNGMNRNHVHGETPMRSRVPWWTVVVFLIAVALIFWWSGGVTPAY